MKTSFAIILMALVGILGFLIGYSIAPTEMAEVRHSVQQQKQPSAGGHTSSGGYGASGGGYGAPASSGGYGAPASSGGYGAPAPSGGYGAPVGGYGAQ